MLGGGPVEHLAAHYFLRRSWRDREHGSPVKVDGACTRALRWESIGSLAPGYHADLIVVDRNALECPIEDPPGTQVHATLLGGECAHGKL